MSERIADSDGRFAGVLVAKMDVAYFDRLYRSLDIGGGGFVALTTTGGTLITRVPGLGEGLGQTLPDTGGVRAALRRDGRFAGWVPSSVEPGLKLISAAAIPGLPLDVVVGATEHAVLAPWRAEAVRIGLQALLTSAAMLALIALAARELARRAAADERVRQSEERYALAVAGANDGIWDRDLVTSRMFHSRRALELLGVDPPIEGFRTFEEWETLIDFHPEDLPRRQAAMAAHIAGETPFYEGEWRVRHADGAYRWVKSRGLCIRDAHGRATRLAGSITDIEERKRYEETLRARQEMLDLAQQAARRRRSSGESAPAGPTGRRVRADARARAGHLRRHLRDLEEPHPSAGLACGVGRDRTRAGRPATSRPNTASCIPTAASTGSGSRGGVLLAAADGGSGRVVGFMLDVTDRRQAEAELQRQTVLLDELIASAPEAIIMYDADWRVVRVNREFTRMFGYTPEEAVGTDVAWRLMPDERAAEIHDARRRLSRGEHISIETVRKRKDGSLFHVSVLGAPIWVGGERIGAFLILRDITERKLAEAEQARLQTRLRQAEKMEAVGRLAGGIAHDFNNILGGLLGYSEMVFAEAAEGTPMKRYARNLLTAANRARDLVDQILTYSRSQHAQHAPVEIDRVVGETLELVRGSLAAGIALDLALPATPLVVVGDPTQLHQVVMNLCTNAIHAMSGSGTLRVALEPVDLAAERVLAHGTLAPGALRAADGGRHRQRDGRGHRGAHLRALLHHQGGGTRHRPRPVPRLRHRDRLGRCDRRRERGRSRQHVRDLPAAGGSAGERRRDRWRARCRAATASGCCSWMTRNR